MEHQHGSLAGAVKLHFQRPGRQARATAPWRATRAAMERAAESQLQPQDITGNKVVPRFEVLSSHAMRAIRVRPAFLPKGQIECRPARRPRSPCSLAMFISSSCLGGGWVTKVGNNTTSHETYRAFTVANQKYHSAGPSKRNGQVQGIKSLN